MISRRAALHSIAGALLAGCGKSERPLIVGMELDYPPFETRDMAGKPAGISVELATALAGKLGRELRIENLPFAGLIPALKTGKIDLIVSSMTITDERRQSIDFSEPYWQTGVGFVTYEGSGLRTAADLAKPGVKVVVKSGTTGHFYARDRKLDFSIVDRLAIATLEVAQRKSAAFLYDQLTLVRTAEEQPGLVPVLDPLQTEPWGIGIAKGRDDLRAQVNAFIAEARERGDFARWAEQYLAKELAAARKWGGTIIH
ncbi:MAG: transporter substrate-binding domain-containing protein [Chthoniobacteraceae bacterium]